MAAKFKKGIDLQGQRAVGAADASTATDLVTLQQMQAAIRGLDWKDSVRAAASGAITATGTQTVDGVSVIAGDRVLRMGDGVNNGIWVVAAGAWARAVDADSSAEVTPGMAVSVEEGTTNGDKAFMLTTNGPIVLGTTSLTFSVLGGGSGTTYVAGNGLSLTGSTFAVVVGNGLLVDASNVRVDPSIVVRKFAADCVATTNPQTFTHGLGSNDVQVEVWDVAASEKVFPDVTKGSGTVIVDWGAAPTAAQYRVVIQA
jgi:hypothetical protein